MAYVLAHLSDPHLASAGVPLSWRDLRLKRALGRTSWHTRRRHIHRPARLAALIGNVQAAGVDHIAVTGDITNFGLPAEFAEARLWLDGLGGPERVSLVPGNHDALLRGAWPAGLAELRAYLPEGLPYLHRCGPLALIGVSSAIPTPPFCAYGRVGTAQAEQVGALLDTARAEGLCRIVLLHHPPVDGLAGARKALGDREHVRSVLSEHGAELVLSGHIHHASRHFVSGGVPVLIAPSASSTATAGWHRIEIEPDGPGWRITTRLEE